MTKLLSLENIKVPYFRTYTKEFGKVEEKSGLIGRDSICKEKLQLMIIRQYRFLIRA